MLGMMILMPSILFARHAADTVIIHRMWNYAEKHLVSHAGMERNVYMAYDFNTIRRNPTLYLVPTMYSIARKQRNYAGEIYGKARFMNDHQYSFQPQVLYSTVPHYKKVMPTLFTFVTPNLYDISIYPDHILSPFHRSNRYFYKYRILYNDGIMCVIRFRPRTNNTQLIRGQVVVDVKTGRIRSVTMEGEYDMLKFKVTVLMNQDTPELAIPERCKADATFKFLGNHLEMSLLAYYNCPTTLPDSIKEHKDKEQMEKLRPYPLNSRQLQIYHNHEEKRQQQLQQMKDTTQQKKNKVKEVLWDMVGENLINSQSANTGALSMRMSPLLNPLYLSYSKSKGVSYRIKFGLQYNFNPTHYLTLNPRFGYNFKQKQFYYTAPLRMTYSPKYNGYTEFTWANGNLINSATLQADIKEKTEKDVSLSYFKDQSFQLVNNIKPLEWLEITAGMVYHQRKSSDKVLLSELGFTNVYRSCAPLFRLGFYPWKRGPVFTVNYEHSFKHLLGSNQSFDRWELDGVYKQRLKSLRILNYRLGSGFYTHRSSNYFVDYLNFRDKNIPSGWEDEWSGQFQLLDSRWYNESNYYLRGHVSFESPLLALTWIPGVGRLLESECVYVSALSIEHIKPYFELGYGFTNRYFSAGLFASFVNTRYEAFGCRFTLELFKRW